MNLSHLTLKCREDRHCEAELELNALYLFLYVDASLYP